MSSECEFIINGMRSIPDFPKPGIMFKDMTPLLEDAVSFQRVMHLFFERALALANGEKIDKVVGIESRGFLFAAPLALRLNAGLVLARKPGKLPFKTIRENFKLEYGEDALEMHIDSIHPGEKVILIDDILATGGTMQACGHLVEQLGGHIQGVLFLQELAFLGGKERLKGKEERGGHPWSYNALVA